MELATLYLESKVIHITINEAVKERILSLCKERNISINKLCTISGVTQSTVNNIINRRNNSVTVATIKKLCDGLDITIIDFFNSDLFLNLEQEIK
jgi:transcriptional regulator with XRE-family HTH domain